MVPNEYDVVKKALRERYEIRVDRIRQRRRMAFVPPPPPASMTMAEVNTRPLSEIPMGAPTVHPDRLQLLQDEAEVEDDVDGEPLVEDGVDGEPLVEDDVDGEPLH